MNCQLLPKGLQATQFWKGMQRAYFCFYYSSIPFPPEIASFQFQCMCKLEITSALEDFPLPFPQTFIPQFRVSVLNFSEQHLLPLLRATCIPYRRSDRAASGEGCSYLSQAKSEQPLCLSSAQQMQQGPDFIHQNGWCKSPCSVLCSHQRAKQVSVRQSCSPKGADLAQLLPLAQEALVWGSCLQGQSCTYPASAAEPELALQQPQCWQTSSSQGISGVAQVYLGHGHTCPETAVLMCFFTKLLTFTKSFILHSRSGTTP